MKMNPNSKRHRRAVLHQRRRLLTGKRLVEIYRRYDAVLKTEFADYAYLGEGERPQRPTHPRHISALRNFRHFAPYIPLLYRRLHQFGAGPKPWRWGGTLTDVAWSCAQEAYAQHGLVLMGFNERRQTCFLRAGLIALAKVLIDYQLP
ncbi:MAG: hypothetical protein KGL39_17625 [Patescibacteria group bacterium]|nr:hypothetical protein [Patescibacteria group bacterium]